MTYKRLFYLLILTVGFSVYIFTAYRIKSTKSIANYSNRSSVHLDFINKIQSSNFNYLGDRNRMPFYYYIQAIFNRNKVEDKSFMQKAININIIISLICITLIILINAKYLSALGNLSSSILIGLTLFLPKIGYIQPEIVYYTLSYLTFLYFIKTLKENYIFNSIISGTLVALSYLTKATIILGFGLFIFFHLIKFLMHLRIVLFTHEKIKNKKNMLKSINIFFSIVISISSFLLILSPYLLENKVLYNKYFYNLNTNTVVWYDSIEQLKILENSTKDTDQQSLKATKDRESNLISYLKKHSLKDILKREIFGVALVITVITRSNASVTFSYSLFCLILSPIIIISSKSNICYLFKFMRKKLLLVLFAGFYIQTYILAFAWYAVVDPGPRFIFSIYIPLLFVLFWLIDQNQINFRGIKVSNLFYLFVILLLIISFKPLLLPTILNDSYTS